MRRDKVIIEPFFDAILNAIMSLVDAVIQGILYPIIQALKAVVKIVVDFVAENILKPMFAPIGFLLVGLVYILKPIFWFIGKILDFIVTVIYFLFSIINMVISLPMTFLQVLGIVNPINNSQVPFVAFAQLTSIISDTNNGLRESAANVNLVINRQNFMLLGSATAIASILLLIYLTTGFPYVYLGIMSFFQSFGK